MQAKHLRNSGEVLQLNLALLFFINDHAELHGLLDLLPRLVFSRYRRANIPCWLHRLKETALGKHLVRLSEPVTIAWRGNILIIFDAEGWIAFLAHRELHEFASWILVADVLGAALHQADCVVVQVEILRKLNVVDLVRDATVVFHCAPIISKHGAITLA